MLRSLCNFFFFCWVFLLDIMFPFCCFNKFLGCFGFMFWVIVYLYYEAVPHLTVFWLPDSMSLNTWGFIRLLLPCVTSSINTSLLSHACRSHHTVSAIFYRWCDILWIISYSTPSPYIFLSIILVEVDLGLCSKNVFSSSVQAFLSLMDIQYCSNLFIVAMGFHSLSMANFTSNLTAFCLFTAKSSKLQIAYCRHHTSNQFQVFYLLHSII